LPSIAISNSTVILDGSGSQTAIFTVQLSQSATSPVTVQYATADGSATAGVNYTPANGTVVFGPNEVSQTISVPVAPGGLTQGTKSFFVSLSAPSGGLIDRSVGVGTIRLSAVDIETVFIASGGTGGGPVPGEPAGTTFAELGSPAINDSGAVSFLTTVRTTKGTRSGVFAGSSIMARDGEEVPGLPGFQYAGFTEPAINTSGGVAFMADLTGPAAAGKKARKLGALVTSFGGSTRVIVRNGGPAPGIDGATIAAISSFRLTDSAIFFTARLSRTGGVTRATDFGLWSWTPGTDARLILRTGQALGAGSIQKFETLGGVARGTGQGRTATADSVVARATLTGRTSALILATADGTSAVLVKSDDLAEPPQTTRSGAGGAFFRAFGFPVVTSGRLITFSTTLGGVQLGKRAVFTGSNAPFNRLIGTGDAIVGLTDTSLGGFSDPVRNDDGSIAFLATLAGRKVSAANRGAIFYSAGGGPLRVIARQGGPAAGIPDAKWKSFKTLALPRHLGPVFVGTLASGAGGVTAANDSGLWGASSDGVPLLLAREGDTVAMDGGLKTIRKISILGPSRGSPDQPRAFSRNGRVAYLAQFTDRTQGVFRLMLP
jgi:hypothetical protein